MFAIEQVLINGQQSTNTLRPIIAGLNPTISWEALDLIPIMSQITYDLRIGTDSTNWGNEFFVGDIYSVVSSSTANSLEYIDNNLLRHITYYCQIRVTNLQNTTTAWFPFYFICNSLPVITNYRLSPTAPTVADNITLDYDYYDADGQDQSGTKIQWFNNNIYQSQYDGLCTLPTSANFVGDSWSAKITPSDGLEFGSVFETAAVTVLTLTTNDVLVSILPENPNVDDILQVEYSVENAYLDTYDETEIHWYINGTEDTSIKNQTYIRRTFSANDEVYVQIVLKNNETIVSQGTSNITTIEDSVWHIDNLTINGLYDPDSVNDLSPILEWKFYKSTEELNAKPTYTRILITKTQSLNGPIYDTGFVLTTKSSFVIPDGILSRGTKYYIHLVASDTTSPDEELYVTMLLQTAGSSWNENVNNYIGWTIEFNLQITSGDNLGVLIHDGTYFCAIKIGLRTVTFVSSSPTIYTFPTNEPDTTSPKTFKIAAQGSNVKIFMNNHLIINGVGILTSTSSLKTIDYGDIDAKNTNSGIFKFFRYSTKGAYGFGNNLPDENTFYFYPIANIENGSVEYIYDNLIAWLPDDTSESTKLIQFNENAKRSKLPTVTKNYSPVTCIYIDENRNKYIGTANGVCALFGEKHDPDYSFITTGGNKTITPDIFDRITTVSTSEIQIVEPVVRTDWMTIDTTTLGTPDEYTGYEYIPGYNHAIHYYSQRTHGHAWYDGVDNEKGWSTSFSLNVELVETENYTETLATHEGFGLYINDGTYQEIIYFYEDRIQLFYANTYVSLTNTVDRDFVITGKGKNLTIYQKLSNAPFGAYNKIIDGSGLFTTPASKTGNCTKPKIVYSEGYYHAVWQDDGNGRSQIFYAKSDGGPWSQPELVTLTTQFILRNPDIDIDSSGKIWVCYEDTSWGQSEISVSVKDSAGWNAKTRVTAFKSQKTDSCIRVDSYNNVHLVWADDRFGNSVIMWALWTDDTQSWTSSGQLGEDTIVAQFNDLDPYQDPSGGESPYSDRHVIDFIRPKISLLFPKIWLVYEAHEKDANTSKIYSGYYDIVNKFWNSNGSIIIQNGEAVGFGVGSLISPSNEDCRNPSLASNPTNNDNIVVWENWSSTVNQIEAFVFDGYGSIIHSPAVVTSETVACINPCTGWIWNYGLIVYVTDGELKNIYYNSATNTFTSGFTFAKVDQICNHPALPQISVNMSLFCMYDFVINDTSETIENQEQLDYSLIGQLLISCSSLPPLNPIIISNEVVNNTDTKEFAFGDFSDKISIRVHWRDFKFYFGYDAKPYSISKYNTSTVSNWPDNRINDLFVDIFGNIIAATFGGLVYHNVSTGKTLVLDDALIKDKIITSIAWGGNGIWFAGTTSGAIISSDAGKTWSTCIENSTIYDIVVDSSGRAIFASNAGVLVYNPADASTVTLATTNTIGTNIVTCVAVDENNIIWAGTDKGLVRIENLSYFLGFSKKNGMRTSKVNDITIVNNNLRYIATSAGVERMNGVSFVSFNVTNLSIVNDNILSVNYYSNTNSLWVGILHELLEIVFRDPAHEIIENEVVYYDDTDLSTSDTVDTTNYYVLDLDTIQTDSTNPLELTQETVSVYLNKNKLSLGYSVDKVGQTIQFYTPLLINDQIEVEISNQFIQYHDFNQLPLEKQIVGEKRTSIIKMARSSQNQLFALSNATRNSLLCLADENARLPFTTILLDKDPPVGCLEFVNQVTNNHILFRIYQTDALSGTTDYILSNYANFTSDGTTALPYTPITTYVTHDIGSEFNNVTDSLVLPTTVEIDGITYTVGTGAALGSLYLTTTNTYRLIAGLSSPSIIYSYDPVADIWTAVTVLDTVDLTRTINNIETIGNVLWITTGSSTGNGGIYRSIDGVSFQLIGSIAGSNARGIAGNVDGSVYFGSSDGKIYRYKNNVFSIAFQNIGSSIYDLSCVQDKLLVATGNQGRIYQIDLTNNSSLIIFAGSDSWINRLSIDGVNSTSIENTILFASAGDHTNIYRCNLGTFDFKKSYSSYSKNINRMRNVRLSVLTDQTTTESTASANASTTASSTTSTTTEETQTVAIIGDSVFSYAQPNWNFVYKHSETINDFVEFSPGSGGAIWVISDSKITKRTNELNTKTVYLKLRDKAGNESPIATKVCTSTLCCDTVENNVITSGIAMSLNINDLKGFVNSSRILDIDPYGSVTFSYNAPNDSLFYSGDIIDEEVGIYTSEILNSGNDLISWKSITWVSSEPTNTSVELQIRSAASEDAINTATWSDNLIKVSGSVSLEHITDQYLQFRAILRSKVRGISPTLTSVILANITANASHFFTTNFILPSRPIKGLLTANSSTGFTTATTDMVVFGVNTTNSSNFADYAIIEPNRLFSLPPEQYGSNLKIGVKLLTPNATNLEETGYEYAYNPVLYNFAMVFETEDGNKIQLNL